MNRMCERGLSALMLSWCVVCAACGGGQWSTANIPEDAYPGELRDSHLLPTDWSAHQRVEARFQDDSVSFTAAIEVYAGELRMLALTSFGTRAFLLEQKGQAVQLTPYVDRDLPFPPRFILLDLHRAMFLGIEAPPLVDGERAVKRGDEKIMERFVHGRLTERRYQRLDHKPEGDIVIRYEGGMLGDTPPTRITIENRWFGYVLVITNLS